jgi:hypothetical protein
MHWLLARESPIDVKGKGQMQTYWCEPWSRSDFMAYLAAMDGNESMCDTICAEERMGGFETASGSDSDNDGVNDDDGEASIASPAEISKDELESSHMEQAPPRPATQRS